jgi:hypothetical protein
MEQMAKLVEGLNAGLGKAIKEACVAGRKLRGHGVTAARKLSELYQTMGKLLPQIRHWLRTGRVATGKIINLCIPELYSIVRGKVGKAVEFGLSWGLTRLRGGFILATMARERGDLHDSSFAEKGRRSRARYRSVTRSVLCPGIGWRIFRAPPAPAYWLAIVCRCIRTSQQRRREGTKPVGAVTLFRSPPYGGAEAIISCCC